MPCYTIDASSLSADGSANVADASSCSTAPPPVQPSTDDVEDPEEAARMAAAQNPVDTHTTIPLPGGSVWIDLDNTIDGARFVSTETKKKKKSLTDSFRVLSYID